MVIAIAAGVLAFVAIMIVSIFGMVAGVLAFLVIIAPFAWLLTSSAG